MRLMRSVFDLDHSFERPSLCLALATSGIGSAGENMQLTREEQKMVELLRRQHASWRTTRAIILICSLACAAFAIWEFATNGFEAMPLLLTMIATYGSSYVLGSWSGRPEISLLLKVIESNTHGSQT